MLNVEQITNRLAQMPDQMLQKYAAMNKNDPYIMALAVSESNRRKELRSAAQGQQGMQPQPKVVDQAVQGMAAPMPESVGIGQLPAGNMNFADGGIVAFAGDKGSLVTVPDYWDPVTGELVSGQQAENLSFTDKLKRALNWGKGQDVDPRAIIAAQKAAGAPPAVSNVYPDESLRGKAANPLQPASSSGVAPKVDTGARIPPSTAPAAAPTGGFAALMKAVDSPVTAGATRSPYAADIEKLNAARVAQSEEEAKGLEALNAKFADAYKGKEERLAKREGELAGMKDQSLGLALLQAGAAMMSTPGSLGVAVGKGVEAGSRQYVAGMDKINAAKEKLADARDRLDDLKLNRDEMSAREILKAKSAITQQKNAGLELLLKADMEENKITRDEALKRLDMRTRIGIEQIKEQGATARANAPSANERIANLLGGGDLEKGLIRLTEIQAGKFNPQNAYAEYLSKRKEGDTVLSPVEFMTALRSVSALQSGAPAPSGKPTGKVFE